MIATPDLNRRWTLADVAAELDAKRAIKQGTELALAFGAVPAKAAEAGAAPTLTQTLPAPVAASLKLWHQMIAENNLAELPTILHRKAVFRSPMAHTPYPSAQAVQVILTSVVQVFEDFKYHRELASADGLSLVLEFSAQVNGKDLKGIDMVQFDAEGKIILCGSFSKTLAPGLRVGWVVPGKIYDKVLHIKYTSSGATATANQRAIAEFMGKGLYQIHLRRMRANYKANRELMTSWISKYFNPSIRISRPQGGYFLWMELPDGVSAYELSDYLMLHNIQIATGKIFSSSGKYENCIRINYGGTLDDRVEEAIKMIGKRVMDLSVSNMLR